jgi:hypothetical protein
MTFCTLRVILDHVKNSQGKFRYLSVGGAGMLISLDMECSVALDMMRTRCDIAHAVSIIASSPGENWHLRVYCQQVVHFQSTIHSNQSMSLLEDLGPFTPLTPLPN